VVAGSLKKLSLCSGYGVCSIIYGEFSTLIVFVGKMVDNDIHVAKRVENPEYHCFERMKMQTEIVRSAFEKSYTINARRVDIEDCHAFQQMI